MKRYVGPLLCTLILATCAQASMLSVVDFEDAAELASGDNQPISTQYLGSHGVSFSLWVGPSAQEPTPSLPTYEQRGNNDLQRGFVYGPTNEFDTEAPSAAGRLGEYFMKSALDVGYVGWVKLVIDYATPVSAASGEIWDIDGDPTTYGTEQWLVTAYDSTDAVVDSELSPLGDSWGVGSLDGLPWEFGVDGDGISRIEIEFVGSKTERVGLAFDNFRTVVPEPASLALVAFGLLTRLRRR